ncbi:collagen alpha-6(IV) chain-like [Grus japonensis]|uniref:Collagen alpha-6(IV) chain-like n=1 Tax=Grus japonensis TaxID=30415 RepID=A0ABC9XE65_GRUJA
MRRTPAGTVRGPGAACELRCERSQPRPPKQTGLRREAPAGRGRSTLPGQQSVIGTRGQEGISKQPVGAMQLASLLGRLDCAVCTATHPKTRLILASSCGLFQTAFAIRASAVLDALLQCDGSRNLEDCGKSVSQCPSLAQRPVPTEHLAGSSAAQTTSKSGMYTDVGGCMQL